MKKRIYGKFILGLVFGFCGIVQASTYLVDIDSPAPLPPYTNAVNAAHSIQAALHYAQDGDVVYVFDGTYLLSSTIVVTNQVEIQAWSQPDPTQVIIDGHGQYKCFDLGDSDCLLYALTIRNGKDAGVSCSGTQPLVDDCIIENTDGTGMVKGRASDCIFRNNTGAGYGGGANGTIATDCTFVDNQANRGGGLYQGTAINCTIQQNQASSYGGGMGGGSATNCLIMGNSTPGSGGGLYSANAVGCAIFENTSGSYGGGMYQGIATHCTMTQNRAETGGGMSYGQAYNSILWNNTASDEYANQRNTTLYTCCIPDFTSNGCITNAPQFISASHLATTSPCIGAGNTNYVVGTDIDGESWNTLPAIGCDEVDVGNVTGTIHPHNDLYDRVTTGQEIYFNAYIDGPVTQTTLDFGDGTVLTNFLSLAHSHAWNYGNYNVILTGYNDDHATGVSITNTVYVRNDSNTTIYVSNLTGDDSNAGDSWATAKKTIQAGVDVQIWNGGLVLVSNGTYAVTSEISVDKDIRIQSLSGLENSTIQGDNQHQCFYLGNQHCRVEGFTIQNAGGYSVNGPSGGGAIYCSGLNPIVSNCTITENKSGGSGGGVMWRGTANHCTFFNNTGGNGPGGMSDGIANDCLFINNVSGNVGGGGMSGGIANRCIFKDNKSTGGGGALNTEANDCQFLFNESTTSGGGMYSGTANNCVFRGNKSIQSGGGAYNTTATHCTFTANQAITSGGGLYSGTANHCILWYNTAMISDDNIAATANYSCAPELTYGIDGNITNNPQLVSASHIAFASPCAGSGSILHDTLDIDGEHWRSAPAMGCDEPADPAVGTPVLTIEGPTDVPAGYEAFYTIDIQGAIERDRIYFGDGQTGVDVAIQPISHVWTSPGTYNMTLRVWNNHNLNPYSISRLITVRSNDYNAIYVTTNGDDSANGRSWSTAKQTIQAAIDAQDLPGGQVVVSNGVYNLTETVKITKDIQLIGLNGAAETIIDGGRTNKYTGIMCIEIDDVHATVDGFTIQNGNDRDSTDYYSGGGIFCHHSSAPQIRNCIFAGNQATEGGALAYGTAIDCLFTNNMVPNGKGGGLYLGNATRCQFIGNSARDGGAGMYAGTATDCTFTQNETQGSGGGMVNGKAFNCRFIENEASAGGGMDSGDATDCLFIKNIAERTGGGMKEGIATRCGFIGNRTLFALGGGMQSGTANSCYFSGNSAYTSGGGTYYTTLNNCTLTGNHAGDNGGGAYAGNANNSIVWNNTAGGEGNDLFSAHPQYTCSPDAPHGTDGCITNNPLLVSASHISGFSPCFGIGNPTLATGTDIDGESWNRQYTNPSMGCDEFTGSLTGPIEISFFGPSLIRALSEGDYIAVFDGQLSKTIIDFGHGTPLTNTVGTITHFWPGPAAQDYDVVLTGFNDDYPQGVSYTQTVAVVAEGSDLHVRYDGSDSNDGLSWTNAKHTIQAGIDAQQVENGMVLVDKNYYAISETLTIDKPIHLKGVDSSGFQTSVIVDAGSSNRCMDISAVGCTVENFTFENGAASTQGYSNNEGGGVRCQTFDPVIESSSFINCTAYYGGGAYKGTLDGCVFSNNVATRGGAVYGSRITYCTISSNSAQYGGGIAQVPYANHSTLSGNHASLNGGGAYYCSDLTNCTLSANTADGSGGGAYESTLLVSTVTSNTAPNGGGLSQGTASWCEISSNRASVAYGGGMYYGTANGCVFYLNGAEQKGGGTRSTTLNNCTVVQNGANEGGGGCYAGTIRNSIIWDNFAWTNAVNVANTTPTHSCFPEADPSNSYYQNITNNPLFVAYAPGFLIRGSDYYLSYLSPCLNAGDNNLVATDRDFNGWNRIFYGTVDMGANEAYFFSADDDGDGMQDGWELENFGGTTNAVATDDADTDAFDNRSEFVAGTDPLDDTSYLHITQSDMEADGTNTQVTLSWEPSVDGRIYGVQWSTNLVDGFQDKGLILPYPHDQIILTNDLPKAFYKISVRLDK